MSATYDVVIIGGGPGGYPAAIRCGQLGMKVACVESRDRLGGTCLNIGCIPSKALLQSTEKYAEAKHGLAAFGVEVSGVKANLAGIMAHKDKVVANLGSGVEFLFRKNKVEWVKGTGQLAGRDTVSVALNDGASRELKAKAIVIATGSDIVPLPGVAIDERRIVSSTGALSLPEIPKRLAVIGGGYIGLELGSVWRRLGSEVIVIESLDRIAAGLDAEVATVLQRVLEKDGFTFWLGTKVVAARAGNDSVTLMLEPARGGERSELSADVVLVAIGRRPYTDGLGLAQLGVAQDERQRIKVDRHFRSSVEGVYAIGDVIAGPMLAHKAEEEGIALAEILAGQAGDVNYEAIPAIVYTWPEVASVGKTEAELKAAGVAYRVGKFPFSANAMARAVVELDGFAKILADAKTDRVLGVHIIGPHAGTMIPEAVLAMEFGAAAEDIARTSHAHPTLPEAVREAALAVDGRTMHL